MKSNITKAIAVLALFTASFGAASCGSDSPEKVATTGITITTTTVDPGPSKEEVDKLNTQIWVNKTNEKIWVDTTNTELWIERTNAQIQAAKERAARQTAPSSGGHGSDFLACVRAHESDTAGGYSAENPTSTASGAYQILDSTWGNYGGYPTASSAPPHVQDERARQLPRSAWNGSGC